MYIQKDTNHESSGNNNYDLMEEPMGIVNGETSGGQSRSGDMIDFFGIDISD